MSCYGPLGGWRANTLSPSGRRRVVFDVRDGYQDLRVTLPCGKCIGCRTDKARSWSVRAYHEAQLWENNAFVTLTYDEKQVPKCGAVDTLRPEDFVGFMKRLREWHRSRWTGVQGEVYQGVRFLQAGEYGKFGRPHHHALLFNVAFPDAARWRRRGDYWLFRSATLERLWPFGYSSFGEVTQASAQYVAQYTLKKMSSATSVSVTREPEYASMSRRPGIGRGWLERFAGDVYPSDRVVIRDGGTVKPPAYYDEQLRKRLPEVYSILKGQRALIARENSVDGQELEARRVCHEARLSLKQREV